MVVLFVLNLYIFLLIIPWEGRGQLQSREADREAKFFKGLTGYWNELTNLKSFSHINLRYYSLKKKL